MEEKERIDGRERGADAAQPAGQDREADLPAEETSDKGEESPLVGKDAREEGGFTYPNLNDPSVYNKAINMETINAIRLPKREELRRKIFLKKRTPLQWIIHPILILILCFGVASSYYVFITPNDFAPGGIYGIGTMVEGRTGFAMGWIVLILSIPIIIAAFRVLDFESALIIALLATITSLIEVLMKKVGFFQYQAAEGDKVTKIFAAIIGGGLSGATFAYTIKIFGTADGTIAIASIVKKKRPDISIAWATFAFDAIVVAASLVVYWPVYLSGIAPDASFQLKLITAFEPIMYSLINMYMVSKVCDVILKGFETHFKFEVITESPEEISNEIFTKLGRGVTFVPVKGMYSKKDKALLICVIRKRQIGDFQKIIKSYPDTFAYLTSTNEVIGYFSR